MSNITPQTQTKEPRIMTTIAISALKYANYDDCLIAVVEDYVDHHPELVGYDFDARWADDQRETILLDIPLFAADAI